MAGGLVTTWYAYKVDHLFSSVIDRDVGALRAAEELVISLLMQKGFLTYYYLDGESKWLDQLEQHEQTFKNWLKKARNTAFDEDEREILSQVESDYINYLFLRDRVIELYRKGQRQAGTSLHDKVRERFYEIYNLCQNYKASHVLAILKAKDKSRKQAEFMNILAFSAIFSVLLFGALLAYILMRQILGPIRMLATNGQPLQQGKHIDNEVAALKNRMYGLIEDADETRHMLEQSQEHLLHSEKWAMVGKLAAGMAHSIRNPLTSVQMRLFSLDRSLKLSETQKEDLEVISEEISHIDTIVQNFLEFSRAPKFQMQRHSPSEVVDHVIQLLRHRLESSAVKVEKRRERQLPGVWLDPEQFKEALVNLLMNACEAMNEGGSILIQEDDESENPKKRVVSISITDTGPGIPESIQEKIFQPFFSTKEEGTGLGLSIAKRIIEGHGGKLDIYSQEGGGTTFTITLQSE